MVWKSYQDKSKIQKNITLAVGALVLLLLLLILGKIIGLLTAFNLPFTKSLVDEKSRIWDGKTSYNLVYASENPDKTSLSQISLINFNPSDKKITVLKVSDMIYSELPRAYGTWRVGSIYQLGEEEGEKKGVVLLKLSLSKILGMPVDGIFISSDNKSDPPKVWSTSWKNPLGISKLLTNAKTDLTPLEFIRLLYFSSKIRSDKIVTLDLSQSVITESKLLPDSTRVLGINYINLDSFLRDNLIDNLLYQENGTVAIYNATDKPGLAQEVARISTNLGANVVFIGNTEDKISKTIVVASSDSISESPFTYQRLASIYAPSCLKSSCSSQDNNVNNSRAHINIILGEDYYNYWYEK